MSFWRTFADEYLSLYKEAEEDDEKLLWLSRLCESTDQDFGSDIAKWENWLDEHYAELNAKHNRADLDEYARLFYKRHQSRPPSIHRSAHQHLDN